MARDEHGSGEIDEAVDERGRDDLAAQAMLFERIGELLHRGGGKIAREHRGEGRIVGQVARHDLRIEVELGIGQQHGEFGPRQALGLVFQLLKLAVARQELHRAVQAPAPLQVAHVAAMGVEIAHGAALRDGERQRLVVVVFQHMRRHVVGHRVKQLVARPRRQLCRRRWRPTEQDLQIDLVVGGVDAGRIVDRIGVDAPAGAGIFDAPLLGDAQIGAFADHLGADLAAIDAHRVVGAVAGFEIAPATPP